MTKAKCIFCRTWLETTDPDVGSVRKSITGPGVDFFHEACWAGSLTPGAMVLAQIMFRKYNRAS